MLKLGVNIDHVATLREARYKGLDRGEPDPIEAALICESAGAHSGKLARSTGRSSVSSARTKKLPAADIASISAPRAATRARAEGSATLHA